MTNFLKNSAIVGAAALSVVLAVPAQAHESTVNGTTEQSHMMFTPEMIMDFAGEDIAAFIAEMEAQGYEVTDMSRTFLGRIKVMMENDEHARNMFFSRSTGELKQDFIMPMNMNNMMGSGSTNGSNNGSMGNMGGSTGNMGGSTGNMGGSTPGNMGGNSSGNMGGTSNNNMGGSNMGGSSNSGSNMMGSGN